MKTMFSIITYFDPYGDMKSTRKEHSRKNFESSKALTDVKKLIEEYNGGAYYNAVTVAPFDKRRNGVSDFDKSYYLTSNAGISQYQSIPGY